MRRSRSILFVEDSYLLAQTAVQALSAAGLDVRAVPDAQAALQLFQQENFDCAVIDVELPGGMGGVELACAMQRIRPGFPVVLATGYDAQSSGAPAHVPVLQKPYRFEDILSAISTPGASGECAR